MDTPPIATLLSCTQCGGELHPEVGQVFLTCPYCSTTVYLDKTQVVFHYSLAPTVDDAKGRGFLARWMAGNQTVKNLDQKSRVVGSSFEYFPLWYFKRRTAGREEILLEPAAATSVSELKKLILPAGDLRKYDPNLDAQARQPSVPLAGGPAPHASRTRHGGAALPGSAARRKPRAVGRRLPRPPVV